MRYLVKTYLGDLTYAKTTALDTLWYNNAAFGLRTSAINNNNNMLNAVWGYKVEFGDSNYPADFDAWTKQPTSLLGVGMSRVLWHDKHIRNLPAGFGHAWCSTNYFFGITHESIQLGSTGNTVNSIHGYNRLGTIDGILAEVDARGSYMSSVILWLWDVRIDGSPDKSTYSIIYKHNEWDYVASHFIYDTGNVRPQWKAHTDLYEALESFNISTLESAFPDRKRSNSNFHSTTRIVYSMGSVPRSFQGYFSTSDIGRDDIDWRDGMELLDWGSHTSPYCSSVMRPLDSYLGMGRETQNIGLGPDGILCRRSICHYLGYPGGSGANSAAVHGNIYYGKDIFSGKDAIYQEMCVFMPYDITKNTNQNNAKNLLRNFYSNEQKYAMDDCEVYTDSDSSHYQFIII